MDQAELDASYDQSVYAPNIKQIQNRYASNSDITWSRLGDSKRFAYGATPIDNQQLNKIWALDSIRNSIYDVAPLENQTSSM